MQNGRSRTDLLPLLRECKLLDTKRTKAGLSPTEHERWLDLKEQLGSKLTPSEQERRVHHRAPTRINTSFATPEAFREAIISNISHGGVFVSTTRPPDIGTKLTLNLRIESTGVRLELPCLVVSQNVGANFSTDRLGMGLRFSELGLSERTAIAQLYEEARSQGDG